MKIKDILKFVNEVSDYEKENNIIKEDKYEYELKISSWTNTNDAIAYPEDTVGSILEQIDKETIDFHFFYYNNNSESDLGHTKIKDLLKFNEESNIKDTDFYGDYNNILVFHDLKIFVLH